MPIVGASESERKVILRPDNPEGFYEGRFIKENGSEARIRRWGGCLLFEVIQEDIDEIAAAFKMAKGNRLDDEELISKLVRPYDRQIDEFDSITSGFSIVQPGVLANVTDDPMAKLSKLRAVNAIKPCMTDPGGIK